MIKLSETMPPMSTRDFIWFRLPEQIRQKLFHYLVKSFTSAKKAKYFLCNSFHEIEPAAIELLHDLLLPIGPLLPASHPGRAVGHFWPEDDSCLDWLSEQDACSVVYVAFGSVTILDQRQFHELALGLELSGRPFLWVVRPNLVDGSGEGYPEGFPARVANRGKMVSWAPQQKVLAHPSIACFMSHCGWNSTMEGVAQGVPFLCWPYVADQFFNATTVCDVRKTGVRLVIGEGGVVTREEVKNKVGLVMSDVKMRARAMKLRDGAWWNIGHGGTSKINFDKLIEGIID